MCMWGHGATSEKEFNNYNYRQSTSYWVLASHKVTRCVLYTFALIMMFHVGFFEKHRSISDRESITVQSPSTTALCSQFIFYLPYSWALLYSTFFLLKVKNCISKVWFLACANECTHGMGNWCLLSSFTWKATLTFEQMAFLCYRLAWNCNHLNVLVSSAACKGPQRFRGTNVAKI